jgi:hypothetical protein
MRFFTYSVNLGKLDWSVSEIFTFLLLRRRKYFRNARKRGGKPILPWEDYRSAHAAGCGKSGGAGWRMNA